VSWTLTEEQQAYRQSVIQFAKRELDDDAVERDARGEFFWDGWRRCAAFGIHGLPFPVQYGGSGADRLTTVVAMEALGYACRDSGLLFSINAQMWACQIPILLFGTEAQKARFLPPLIQGELVSAHGASEPGSGSDVNAMRTRAVRRDDRYVLNGTKTFVTNAPISDLAIVFGALESGAKGFGSVTAFIVERGMPGFSVSREIPKMGLRTSPMGEILLEDCEVPIENRLGPEGGGFAIFNRSMEWERSCILASQVGVMAHQLETSVAYAQSRQQFGQPIGKFQHVSGRLVDMKIRLETCRTFLYRVATSTARGTEQLLEAAIAKAYVSECAVQSGLDAIQVHGGYGYATESGIERALRDAIGGRIYSGTTEIQKTIIARCLGL
jgi:alkylation response protein AidB-like acyl-CoA dehydrogenase